MIIRKGTLEDIPALHDLIVELAIYEKEPTAVKATLDEYCTAWNAGVFEFTVAVEDDKIIGIALYYLTFSTWKGKMLYLEDFVVTETHRQKGIGQKLFNQVIEEARSKNCKLLKWQVLDWNIPALNFYNKYYAEIEKNWWNGKIILA
jgi:GNAT superfamily N-acetyltransferase